MSFSDSRIPRLSSFKGNALKSKLVNIHHETSCKRVLVEKNMNESGQTVNDMKGRIANNVEIRKTNFVASQPKKLKHQGAKRSFSSGIPVSSSSSLSTGGITRSVSMTFRKEKVSQTDFRIKTPEPQYSRKTSDLSKTARQQTVPSYYYNELNSLEFEKKLELQKLTKECEIKQNELSELKSNVMIMKSHKLEKDAEHQALEGHIMEYKKRILQVEREIANMDKLAELKKQELQQNFDLEMKELVLQREKQMHDLKQQYLQKIQELHYDKIEAMQKEKTQLASLCADLKEQQQSLDKSLESELNEKKQLYKHKETNLLQNYEQQKANISSEIHAIDTKIRNTSQEISKIEHDLKNNTIKESQINIQLAKYSHINKQLESSTVELHNTINTLQQEYQAQENRIADIKKYMEQSGKQKQQMHQQLIEEETIRRSLHNKLLDLKGNIRVFCRVRPPKKSEEPLEMQFPDELDEGSEIVLKNESPKGTASAKFVSFSFDKVFQASATNSDVFEEISQLVQSALDGYNVCVFAYGQTGSGKTYTMSSKHDGMIPRAVNQIFDASNTLKEKGWDYKITGQFLEIYNETINDLLNALPSMMSPNKAPNKQKKKYEIRHDQTLEKTTITNLTEVELTSPEMVDDILVTVNNNKSVAATKANEGSSRSHSIFRIMIQGNNHITNESCDGLLNLIDLAGSERLSHSQVTGNRLKETQSINKSLSCLGDVIYALGNGGKNSHVPFRNSKLTYLLQYSLSGNSKTLMFVNISPEKQYFGETVNSLRFASKVNCTKVNRSKTR